jgi:glycosyltransferase involved in cell wall biosynthesis
MTNKNNPGEKPIVLLMCSYYLPGFKAGGGLRTVVHMVERFKNRFDFRIITRDHDVDGIPYLSVKANEWNEIDDVAVFYVSKNNIKISKIRELIFEVNPQVIYINSVFSTFSVFLLVLRRLKLVRDLPVILAPEGELTDGSLQIKALKKKTFITFAKIAGLYRDLIWKVTAEQEKAETERFKGRGGDICIAPNMPPKSVFADYKQELKPTKNVGEAKMIFLARIMKIKNFKWLAELLNEVQGVLEIDIYGPIEDEVYWKETQKSIEVLPANVKIRYKGAISHQMVHETLFKYQFFILPTLGENFGHVFIEALSAGCPLIISNRTPWNELEDKKIGWDLPLEEPGKWLEVINHCIKLDGINYRKLSENSRKFACQWLNDPKIEESTLNVLDKALGTV